MKKKVLLLFTGILLPFVNIKAQETDTFNCAFDSLMQVEIDANPKMRGVKKAVFSNAQRFRDKNPNLKFYPKPQPESCDICLFGLEADSGCFKSRYALPVIVHIIHLPTDSVVGSGSNISNSHVHDAIATLNRSFAGFGITDPRAVNTGIQFYLAPAGQDSSGIIRYPSTHTHNYAGTRDLLRALVDSQWLNGQYIHLFIVNEIFPSGIQGYASYPRGEHEGIVVRRKRFGSALECAGCDLDAVSRGKTVAHEFGHFLGLLHTFKDSCAGMDSTDCHVKGDGCCDTPPIAKPNFLCPHGVNSCNEQNDTTDQVENFMDYTSETCSKWFTRNQAEIMYSVLNGIRSQLADVDWLAANNPDICMLNARFKSNNNLVCDSGTVNLRGIPYNNTGIDYRWTIYDTTNNPILDTLIADNHQFEYNFNSLGKYHVRLQVIVQGDTAEETVKDMIWVTECEATLQSEQGNWFFGEYAGLVFTESGVRASLAASGGDGNPPTINTSEGGVSISDSMGNLLYYGSGVNFSSNSGRLYNSEHAGINNPISQLLTISGTSAQSCLSFPCPFDTGKIMLMHNTGDFIGNLYYTLLQKDSVGLIELAPSLFNIPVTLPGIALNNDSAIMVREFLTTAPKCDGRGYWVAIVARHNDFNDYLTIISVDTNGIYINDTSLVPNFNIYAHLGQAKFSPDATKLALLNHVYDFDRKTGKVKYKIQLPMPNSNVPIYGLSYSPNSRYLYWLGENDDNLDILIYRINLALNNPLDYKDTIGYSPNYDYFNSMQLGPDNKLYIANSGADEIAVIHSPDKEWSKTELNPLGYEPFGASLKIGLTGGSSTNGLPNMIDAKKYNYLNDTIYYTIKDCKTVDFSSSSCCADYYLWIFGDGDTSQQKEAEHTYSSYGNYVVKLVLNHTDTLYVDLFLPIPQVTILGLDTVCNFNLSPLYIAQDDFSSQTNYNWTIDSGEVVIVYPETPNNAYVNFTRFPALLKVTATDPVTDCQASDSMFIIYHNDMDYNWINTGNGTISYCNNHNGQFNIQGSTPTGSIGIYNYQWLISHDSITWHLIEGEDARDLGYMTVDSIAFIQRHVESNGCEHLSNVVKVIPQIISNKIFLSNSPCPWTRTGSDSAIVYSGAFHYKWQVSDDTINWIDHLDYLHSTEIGKSVGYNQIVFDTTFNQFHLLYIRRMIKASSNNCENRSNVIKVLDFNHEDVNKIQFYTQDSSIIHGVEEVQPLNMFEAIWQKSCDGTEWQDIDTFYSHDSLWQAKNYGLYYIRRKLISTTYNGGWDNCDDRISNTIAPVIAPFSITSHPSAATAIFVGDSVTFEVSHNGNQNTLVQWQVSNDTGATWTDINGAMGLQVKIVGDHCNNEFRYRAKVFSNCQNKYSNAAELTVNKDSIGEDYDYMTWLKTDPWHQNAQEPYLSSNWTTSPDIFVNQTELTYRPSITRNIVNIDSNSTSVYVHTYIRNEGTVPSEPAQLFLYYTRNMGAPRWEMDFSDQLQSYFRQISPSVTVLDINYYFSLSANPVLFGGTINDTAIYVPSINPGDSILIAYNWTNVPPPYEQHYFTPIGGATYTRHSMLFYARIETCDNVDKGMNYPEDVFPNSNNLSIARYNTRRNARIAALSSYLLHPHPPQSYTGGPDHVSAIVSTAGAVGGPVQGIRIDASNHASFFNKCEMIIQMDNNLWDAWVTKSQGSGFTVVSPGVFKVSVPALISFDSLLMAEDSVGHLGFYFQYKTGTVITGSTTQYHFDVEFLIDDTLSGGIQLHIDAEPDEEGPPSAFMDNQNNTSSLNQLENTPLVFSARPNPFSNELKVFVANFSQGAVVTMYDMNGKQLNSQPLDIGNKEQVITFQTAHLSEGVYYVHYQSTEENTVRKIVLVR